MKETKEEKFKRLAEARTNRILRELRLLGNLSNKCNYSYDQKQVNKIFRVISEEIVWTKMKFVDLKKIDFGLGASQAGEGKCQASRDNLKESETPKETKLKTAQPKDVRYDIRCDNCFQYRKVRKYANLWLCDLCWRKRKTIRKIKAKNNSQNLGSFIQT